MKRISKFKKGAASFYIVAISTLILVIIAASFAAVIISEITRTSNDDLAQSAYDSALAGIEDGKLAYYNYQSCLEDGNASVGSGLSCGEIIDWIENGNAPGSEDSCDMVATILGRGNGGEVLIKETSQGEVSNEQAYTCVKVSPKTKDILGELNESSSSYTVRVKFDGVPGSDTNVVDKIDKMVVKWHSDNLDEGQSNFSYANYNDASSGLFENDPPVPAVISVGMIQTATEFSLSDFDMSIGKQTDRGTVYLVPVGVTDGITEEMAKKLASDKDDRYEGSWNGEQNIIVNEKDDKNSGFLKSNDKTTKNLPYAVYCNGDDFACSATIEIPRPVGGARNGDTFVFKVSLPYGGPSTHFALEFYCGDDDVCSKVSGATDDDPTTESNESIENSNQAVLDGVQISIDSTGRANDLYRRVEVRLTPENNALPYPLYAIELLGSGSESLINKDVSSICEWNFGAKTCSE